MIKALVYLIAFLGFPGLVLTAYLASQETDILKSRISAQQRQLAGLAAKLDGQQRRIHSVAWDVEQVADETLARCATKTPRAPLKLKGRK